MALSITFLNFSSIQSRCINVIALKTLHDNAVKSLAGFSRRHFPSSHMPHLWQTNTNIKSCVFISFL